MSVLSIHHRTTGPGPDTTPCPSLPEPWRAVLHGRVQGLWGLQGPWGLGHSAGAWQEGAALQTVLTRALGLEPGAETSGQGSPAECSPQEAPGAGPWAMTKCQEEGGVQVFNRVQRADRPSRARLSRSGGGQRDPRWRLLGRTPWQLHSGPAGLHHVLPCWTVLPVPRQQLFSPAELRQVAGRWGCERQVTRVSQGQASLGGGSNPYIPPRQDHRDQSCPSHRLKGRDSPL